MLSKILRLFSRKAMQSDSNAQFYGSISFLDEKGVSRAVELSKSFDGPIIEIGALFGHTTNFIASIAEPTKEIIAVDNFRWNPFGLSPASHRQFTERTLRYIIKHRNVSICPMDSTSFFKQYQGPRPSMVFIDAGHDYEDVMKDIEHSIKLSIPIISGHDFCSKHEGVMKAVKEKFGARIEVHGTVWIHCANTL